MMKACARTDVGRIRKINQDSIFATVDPVGPLSNLFLVADGMGGHKAGDYASRYVAEHLPRYIRLAEFENSSPVFVLRQSIEEINRKLFEVSLRDPELAGMGTTLVAGTIEDGILYVANIGDSRLYLIRRDGIRQITRDHSYVEEMVLLGQMDRGSQNYQYNKNIITRAVGIDKNIETDFFEVNLKEGDYILLCSDGLTNMVDNASIFRIASLPGSLEQKAESLITLANQNGGKDNIAVVLVEPQKAEVDAC